jgi:hypothetical protein
MRLTPRGTEVKAVVELLESEEFDSAEALAKAILKRTAELLAERDFYAWVYRETPDAFYISHGPFTSETEAKRFAGKYVGSLKGQHMILPLFSTAQFVDRLASHKLPNYHCADCNHQLISHEHPKIQPKCAVRGCRCRKAVPQ